MAIRSQFEEFEAGRPAECAVCEAMLPDAVDGALSAAEQQAFDKHVAGCITCARELAEARRGAAWLALLKGHAPEPPAALLQRILAETTDAAANPAAIPLPASLAAPVPPTRHQAPAVPAFAATSAAIPAPTRRLGDGLGDSLAQVWRKLAGAFSFESTSQVFQPRMAMTAAMAFFSIALTLNLTGIRLSDVGHALTQPLSVRRTMADAGAKAERSFQNLRVVYAVESRVSDLRNNAVFGDNGLGEDQAPGELEPGTSGSASPAAAPAQTPALQQPDAKPRPSGPHGSSDLQFPVEPMAASAPAVRKGV